MTELPITMFFKPFLFLFVRKVSWAGIAQLGVKMINAFLFPRNHYAWNIDNLYATSLYFVARATIFLAYQRLHSRRKKEKKRDRERERLI